MNQPPLYKRGILKGGMNQPPLYKRAEFFIKGGWIWNKRGV